ncbi:uncharacterized protein JCM6883_004308 [Sporobolomyces salmoneus]|uniref:uncharacterized protein n=1 Tax=Sporobolomyces salmoneus TaxID=183962 RepID=UPI00316B0F5B
MKRSGSPPYEMVDPEESDPLDFLPPLIHHRARPSPSSSSHLKQHPIKSKPKQKSAGSIQTPSASPRHVVVPASDPFFPFPPIASTSSTPRQPHEPPEKKKRRRTSELVFKRDREVDELTPRKERILRRRSRVEHDDDTSREARQSGGGSTRSRGPREQERRIMGKRRGKGTQRTEIEQLVAQEAAQEEEEEYVKSEEPSDEEVYILVKDEELEGGDREEEPEFIREQDEAHADDFAEAPRRRDPYSSHRRQSSPQHSDVPSSQYRRQTSHDPNFIQARPKSPSAPPPLTAPSPSATPAPASSIPSLSTFLLSLDLPQLSRLIPSFHSLGISSPTEVLALASTTTAGQRRRERVYGMVEEMERERLRADGGGQGGEFTKFERETIEVGLMESRENWGL